MILGTYNEGADLLYKAVLKDTNGNPITPAELSVLTLTLSNRWDPTHPVVGGLDHVNVLTDLDNTGAMTYTILAAAMIIVGDRTIARVNPEEHVILLEWTTTGGGKGDNTDTFFVTPVDRL